MLSDLFFSHSQSEFVREYRKDSKFPNSEYKVRQAGRKDSGSKHVSFLVCKVAQLGTKVRKTTAATACDRPSRFLVIRTPKNENQRKIN
jgi:hypothetical protein